MTTTAASRYIVQTAAACMPGCCKGTYRRVAVLELEPGFEGTPKMISSRARGVRRVVATWERQNVGSTERCAYARALAAAEEMADDLNEAVARWAGAWAYEASLREMPLLAAA